MSLINHSPDLSVSKALNTISGQRLWSKIVIFGKIKFFWVSTPYTSVGRCLCFGVTCYFYFQCKNVWVTKQTMYVQRKVVELSLNRYCCGQATSIVCSECVCSLSYPACAALYCHLWTVGVYHIFPLHTINGTIFRKSYKTQYVVLFSLQILSEIFLTLRRI